MFKNTEHFELYDYLENLFDDKLNMIFTSQPATINSFNPDENTLSVTLDKEGLVLEDIPITLLGNPSSYITTPTLTKGTKGLLIFSKHDLFSWVEDGVDQEAKTDFSKNNAFFLIGATNQKNKINYNMNAIEMKTDKAYEFYSRENQELFSLLVQTLNTVKRFADEASKAKDETYQLNLTNSSAFSSLKAEFEELETKLQGFTNG